ncbi:MAG: sugar phosphate isomerase/epimerase family protein [Candidatus Aminicenantales bacterium]
MFIKSISYWSFPGGLEGTASLTEVFAKAKEAGFDGVELALSLGGELSLATSEKGAKQVVEAARDNGIQITSLATGLFWGRSLSSDNPEVRAEALAIAKKLIEVAAWLEAGAVLLIPGAVDVFFDPSAGVVDYQAVYQRASDAVASLLPQAQAAGVVIGIENVWNKFLVDPLAMRSFIDQFGSPWVGAYFDVGNSLLVGYPEQWIRILSKRIKRVHLKDFRRSVGTADGFVDLLSGDVNWPEVMKALREVGYSGPLTAEMIPIYKHAPEILIENTSRAMDAILKL